MGNDYQYEIKEIGYKGTLEDIEYSDFIRHEELAIMAIEDCEIEDLTSARKIRYPITVVIKQDERLIGVYIVGKKIMRQIFVTKSLNLDTGLWETPD